MQSAHNRLTRVCNPDINQPNGFFLRASAGTCNPRDTDADIRVFRRIRRDMRERGRDFNSIRKQYYKTVRPMHLEFVEPSKRYADVIIPEGGDNLIALDLIIERLKQFAN